MFWFQALKGKLKPFPKAGIFLGNVFRTFLEVAILVYATVTAILYKMGAFSLCSSSTNFFHEKLKSCSAVLSLSMDCVQCRQCLFFTPANTTHLSVFWELSRVFNSGKIVEQPSAVLFNPRVRKGLTADSCRTSPTD